MLRYRLTFGPVMIALLLGSVWADDAIGKAYPQLRGAILLAIGLLVCIPIARELRDIFKAGGFQASARSLYLAGSLGLLAFAASPRFHSGDAGAAVVGLAALLVMLSSAIWHLRHKEAKGAAGAICTALFAFVYFGLMFGFILALRHHQSAWVVFGVLAVTKSCDIGAYAVGCTIGRHKLIPWLSPGKTWEGLAGGTVTAAAIAGLATLLFAHRFPEMTLSWTTAAALGAVCALIGQGGDLLASALKRDVGIKDSGSIVPGFGGALDILDSLVFVGPLAYWVLRVPA